MNPIEDRKLSQQLDFNIIFLRQLDRCGDLSTRVHSEEGTIKSAVYNYKVAIDHLASLAHRHWDKEYKKTVPDTRYHQDLLKMMEKTDRKLQLIIDLSFRRQIIREEPTEDYENE